MSFLDNLENNLKAMESLEASGLDDRKRRELERERSIASAPWAERLKKRPSTSVWNYSRLPVAWMPCLRIAASR